MIKERYQELYSLHGDSPLSVQWSETSTQYARFEQLYKIIDNEQSSVIDVGCGLAHFADFLIKKKFKGHYIGLDFVKEFIESNSKKYNTEQFSFFEFDINESELNLVADYVFLSGVFNNKRDDNEKFMYDTISKMFQSCQKGIAFNAMSTYVDFQVDDLYYSNPLAVFDFCKKNLSRKVTLKHDYILREGSIPFEYVIYVYK